MHVFHSQKVYTEKLTLPREVVLPSETTLTPQQHTLLCAESSIFQPDVISFHRMSNKRIFLFNLEG